MFRKNINHEPHIHHELAIRYQSGGSCRTEGAGSFATSTRSLLVSGKILLFIFLVFLLFPVSAPSQEAEPPQSENPVDFYLVHVLETAFCGELRWRPDWPADIPPDAFLFSKEDGLFETIEISNESRKFTVRRDSEGRLIEFPFFAENGYLKVEVSYTGTGAIQNMSISIKNFTSQEETLEEKSWSIIFPDNFLPYSDLSLGGSFPPITASRDDLDFYVFIFESPGFLTETWYDSDGNMLTFCKAQIFREKNWFIRSLQVHDESGFHFIDYYFDSFGNISEIRSPDKTFSAWYRERRPLYWQGPDFQYELQWDTQGLLNVIKPAGEEGIEYRYEYEKDGGTWIKRQETAIITQFGLLMSQPSYSRGIWTRTAAPPTGD